MRKAVPYALGAVILALLGAIAFSYQQYRKASADYARARADSETMQSRYAEAISEIAAIQDSLNAIMVKGTSTQLTPTEQAVERRLNETGGDKALARIAVIKDGIERAKVRIEQLNARLAQYGIKMAGLQKMVDNLNQSVAEKEAMVADLSNQVNTLQTQVSGLSTQVTGLSSQVEQQTATIEDKQRELGTIYYVIGSKKTLTDSHIVEAKGGVLGMGKTLKPTGQISDSMFTALDTDAQDVIAIPAAKAQVVSAQPPNSYELLPNGSQLELRILDAKVFRTVKHLVIVTT